MLIVAYIRIIEENYILSIYLFIIHKNTKYVYQVRNTKDKNRYAFRFAVIKNYYRQCIIY